MANDDAPLAAQSETPDADILNLFLTLERVQAGFYRAALHTDRLNGDLLTFAKTVGAQEREHVAFLERHLGEPAERPPQSDFDHLLGHRSGLPRRGDRARGGGDRGLYRAGARTSAAPCWRRSRRSFRSRPGRSRGSATSRSARPAPHAADPARPAEEILADLRDGGFIQ